MRMATLLHGTTLLRAEGIISQQGFGPKDTFFASRLNRQLAIYFAQRKAGDHPREGGPALVIVTMPEEDFEFLRKRPGRESKPLLYFKPFDQGDQRELVNQLQLVVQSGAIDSFNSFVESWSIERLP